MNAQESRILFFSRCLLAGCLAILFSSSACSVVGKTNSSVNDFLKGMYEREKSAYLGTTNISGQKITNFEEALERSVLASEDISLLALSWKKDLLMYEQAKSQLFPRFSLSAFNRTFFSNESQRIRNIVDGGIVVDYNFAELLVFSDVVAIEREIVKKNILHSEIAIQKTYEKLLTLLLEIDLYSRIANLYEKEESALRDGLAAVEKSYGLGRSSLTEVWNWRALLRTAAEKLEESRRNCLQVKQALASLVGQGGEAEITISDFQNYSPDISSTPEIGTKLADALDSAWKNRSEIRLAEIDLLLSEIAYAKSKKHWTDYFRISLGFGKYYDYRYDEYANFSINTSISLPLFHFGDVRRKELTAQLERDAKRTMITGLARKIMADVEEALATAKVAYEKFEDADKRRMEMTKSREVLDNLIGRDRASVLDFFSNAYEALEEEVKFEKTRFDLKQALIRLKMRQGRLVDRQLEDKLLNKMFKIDDKEQ